MIKPGETVDYYRAYDHSVMKDMDIRLGEVITFLFDGQLIVTDGTRFEDVNCIDGSEDMRYMKIHYPVEWRTIPKGASILEDTGEEY